jgi:hypothetical protein
MKKVDGQNRQQVANKPTILGIFEQNHMKRGGDAKKQFSRLYLHEGF